MNGAVPRNQIAANEVRRRRACVPTFQRCLGASKLRWIGLEDEAPRPTDKLFVRAAMCSPPTPSAQGARPGTNFTMSSDPASWIAYISRVYRPMKRSVLAIFSEGWMRLSPRLNRHRLIDRTPRPKITTAAAERHPARDLQMAPPRTRYGADTGQGCRPLHDLHDLQARAEERGFNDAMMMDYRGHVAECSAPTCSS